MIGSGPEIIRSWKISRSWNMVEDRTIRSCIRTSSIDDDLSLDDLKWDEDDDLDETFVASHNQTIKPNGNHPSVENLPFSGDPWHINFRWISEALVIFAHRLTHNFWSGQRSRIDSRFSVERSWTNFILMIESRTLLRLEWVIKILSR